MVSCQHRVDLPRCCSRIALWKLVNRNIVQTLVGASDVCSSTRVCEVMLHTVPCLMVFCLVFSFWLKGTYFHRPLSGLTEHSILVVRVARSGLFDRPHTCFENLDVLCNDVCLCQADFGGSRGHDKFMSRQRFIMRLLIDESSDEDDWCLINTRVLALCKKLMYLPQQIGIAHVPFSSSSNLGKRSVFKFGSSQSRKITVFSPRAEPCGWPPQETYLDGEGGFGDLYSQRHAVQNCGLCHRLAVLSGSLRKSRDGRSCGPVHRSLLSSGCEHTMKHLRRSHMDLRARWSP